MKDKRLSRLSTTDINQIAEFGQNPIKLFDKPHPSPDDRVADKVVFDMLSETTYYIFVRYGKWSDNAIIRIISKDRFNVTIIGDNNVIEREILLNTKGKFKTTGVSKKLNQRFSVYNNESKTLNMDASCAFSYTEDYLAIGRNYDNSFTLYNLSSLNPISTIYFHKVPLNTIQ